MPRLRIHLSTLLVVTVAAAALLGINMHPYSFYYPRPGWTEDLKYFVVDGAHPDPFVQCGLYGWPFPAFPSWNWCGNGDTGGEFPQWSNYTRGAADIHVACNWARWNKRALCADAIANVVVLAVIVLVLQLLRRVAQALVRRISEKNVVGPGIDHRVPT
jgi:hypothetical protein